MSERRHILSINVLPGCLFSQACVDECPEIFEMIPDPEDNRYLRARVRPGTEQLYEQLHQKILNAADSCCVDVIRVIYDDGSRYDGRS